jgi:RND family efflux transporter MFP subunit
MEEARAKDFPPSSSRRKLWLIPALLVVFGAVAASFYSLKPSTSQAVHGAEHPTSTYDSTSDVNVEVIKPTKGVLERKTSQAGTVEAFEWANIRAQVSGQLKKQTVDRGSLVKKGDVLIEIDVPDLKARAEQMAAAHDLANAQVKLKMAAIDTAVAEKKGIQAKIQASVAKLKSDKAYLKFRVKQTERFRELLAQKSIDARLVDEQEDRREAAVESVNASTEAVHAAEAAEESATAKIEQAKADHEEAKQMVKVKKAELDYARAMVDFATIKAPFDGVITARNFHVGDFIQSATGSSSGQPLLTIEHIRKMRMVVPIPDRDVPYCEPGATATIVFDALPKLKFTYNISRIETSEDLQTKTMRAEIDIPNDKTDPSKGRIRQGMYGLATIVLKRVENALSIPSACLVGEAEGGKAAVYVVRDGKAHRAVLEIGLDNGIDVEVLKGLRPDDQVVVSSSGGIGEDVAVTVTEADKTTQVSSTH